MNVNRNRKYVRDCLYIRFVGFAKTLRLGFGEIDDAEIERARQHAEKLLGRALPKGSKTGFPEFTVYQNGEEIGVGGG